MRNTSSKMTRYTPAALQIPNIPWIDRPWFLALSFSNKYKILNRASPLLLIINTRLRGIVQVLISIRKMGRRCLILFRIAMRCPSLSRRMLLTNSTWEIIMRTTRKRGHRSTKISLYQTVPAPPCERIKCRQISKANKQPKSTAEVRNPNLIIRQGQPIMTSPLTMTP